MNTDKIKLERIANIHKRLLESFRINAGSYKLNNHVFFWVNYYKFGKMNGHAVISADEITNQDEYKKAFYYLSKSSQLRSNLARKGGARAMINMRTFSTTEEFLNTLLKRVEMEGKTKQTVVDCLEAIKKILSLQDELVEKYKTFYQIEDKIHSGRSKYDTEEHLEHALNFICEFDYIQYTQLNTQYDVIPQLEQIKKLSKRDKNIRDCMTNELDIYLKEFINTREDLLNNIKRVTFSPKIGKKLSKEEHMEEVKISLLQSISEVTENAREKLRFPVIK